MYNKKISILTLRKVFGNSKGKGAGGGGPKSKRFKESMCGAKLEFPNGWGFKSKKNNHLEWRYGYFLEQHIRVGKPSIKDLPSLNSRSHTSLAKSYK